MTVAQTSIDAYHAHHSAGSAARQTDKINACLQDSGKPLTRREISVITGIEPGAVGGRVNELIENEYLDDFPSRKCDVTGRTVKTVYFKNKRTSK